MRKLAMLFTAVALGAGLPGGASAALLRWDGTISLAMVDDPL